MDEFFDFESLFVLDMANNHQGNVEHGLKIIRQVGKVVRERGVRAALKFQFRVLDSFIHPDHDESSSCSLVPRLLTTKLEWDQYKILFDAVKAEGMYTMCTPFDEESVDVITDMGFDLIKVASCSAKDWPLLAKIAEAGLPLIFSTGGLTTKNTDDVVSFLNHRGVDFSIMHCVSIYPIPETDFHLNHIDFLRRRYRQQVIGWSTHEDPDDTLPVQMAVAKKAKMFERHIGVATSKNKLNAYSSTPEQIDKWLGAYQKAHELCGGRGARPIPEAEQSALDSLRRGVYLKKGTKAGTTLSRDDVYFSIPYIDNQLDSGIWKGDIVLKKTGKKDEPVMLDNLDLPPEPEYSVLKSAVHEVKALLNNARIELDSEFQAEFSHHYGISQFREVGAVIINCINREYCKKIIIQVPDQKHPTHFHKRKEETFQILYGILELEVDGHRRTLHPGDTCLVQPGVWHRFWTETGCVFEEVSTTHYNDDSYYNDKRINRMKRDNRKTVVEHWGRFQLAPKADFPAITD